MIRWGFNINNWVPTAHEWKKYLCSVQPEEAMRISEFVFKKSAKMSMAGRLMLRHWAYTVHNIPWRDVSFSRTDKGRPYLVSHCKDNLGDVNISHQGDWVILASSNEGKIGVDVMKVDYKGGKSLSEFFRLMKRQFTDSEWNEIKSHGSEDEQLCSFYRHWCLKESVVKALGVGIGYHLKKISLNINTPNVNVNNIVTDTTVVIEGNTSFSAWSFEESKLDHKHNAAVATLNEPNKGTPETLVFKKIGITELMSTSNMIHEISDEIINEFMKKEEGEWL